MKLRIGWTALTALAAAAVCAPQQTAPPQQYPFQNPDLPVEERVNNIISLLTADEKIACLGTNPSVPRLGIRGTGHSEGLHGLALGGPGGWGRPVPIPTTQFAQEIGMGETWDPGLIRLAGGVEGYEARYINQSEKTHRGSLVIRAPNADLGRDPRWGRTEESFGEDPYFNGKMVAAMVKGLQGDDPKYWLTAALMKHFLANSNEDGRGGSSSDFDARLLREYYSVPFRMGVIEGGSRAYMAAYNAMNHIPMTVHPILREITMKEWGLDGIICTDAGSLRNMVNPKLHNYYKTNAEGLAGAVKAGINQFLESANLYRPAAQDALQQGLLTEKDIETAIRGEFRVMIRLGLLDPPEMVKYASIKGDDEVWQRNEHKEIAKRVARESVVLLKNANGLLPFDKAAVKSIAVVGPLADVVALDWYSGTPGYVITPLEGIRNKVGGGIAVNYAPKTDIEGAIKAARESEVAVVFVGNHPTCDAGWAKCPTPSDGKEAIDRKAINLEQEEFVKQIFAANPKTVVVLLASFPIAINWSQENIPAILHITHNAQEEGTAIADALFGDVNPAGRLVQTWPKSLDQVPPMMDYNIRNGRTYMYFKGEPLYPFGFGLSYTTFQYSNLKLSAARLAKSGDVTVSVNVKNAGRRKGDEVVQLYVSHLNSRVERARKELKGFQRLTLEPNETRTVTLRVKAEDLAWWDEKQNRWVVEEDQVKFMVGSSSADARLERTISVVQ
ncbi:MAG: glycoside hydrolase family 3 C-terminal domain-containing protein [Acidobacteriia bacterium]|nr:glycoside hydrolase family 3 C-terminal domain-containing protein [Terriglobia bacterium]